MWCQNNVPPQNNENGVKKQQFLCETSDSNNMNTSATNTNDTDKCAIFGWNTTIPWDNPKNLISVETEVMIGKIKAAILMPILYLIGAPANVISMVVFFKQGLNERINLCLFLLALVDFTFLTFLLILYAGRIPSLSTNGEKYGMLHQYMVNNNVIGLYGLSYGVTLISAVISTERCVCVLFPLHAQRCIPTKIFACMLVISVCVVTFMRFVVTAKYRAACFYEVRTGRTSWQVTASEFYFQNKHMLNILDGTFYGFCLAVSGPLVVFITTIITAVKLRQIIRWRDRASSTMSSKEIGLTKMLICLSIEFFIFSIPFIILRILPMFQPQFNAGGHYANTYLTFIGFAELCSYTSSCVNLFVYYFTGSRYRETLHHLLGVHGESKGKIRPSG